MNGPLVTEFKADDDFQIYKRGTLSQVGDAKLGLAQEKSQSSSKSDSSDHSGDTIILDAFDDYGLT